MAKQQLWSRDYVVATIVNFFVASVFYMLVTTAAVYAFERFAASEALAGVVSGSFVAGAVVARVFAGKYLDLLGRKRLLLAALAVGILSSVIYLFLTDPVSVIAVRALHGFAFGVGSTAVIAGAFSLIPASRRGEGTGYFGISSTLANGAGPVVGLMLIAAYGYDWLFVASAAFCVIAFLGALVLRLPAQHPTEAERRDAWRLTPSSLIDFPTLPIASMAFVATLGFAGIVGFLDAYARSEGDEGAAALFFAVFAVVVVISRLFVGRIQDRAGDNAVIPALIVIYVAGLIVLSISPTGLPLIAAALLIGFGFGALFPCLQAVAVGISPQRLGLVASTFYLLADASIAAGPMIFGWLLPVLGYRGGYLMFAVAALASLVIYYFVHGKASARRSDQVITGSL